MERAGSSGAGAAATGLPMAARGEASSLLLIGGWMAAAGSAGFCKEARTTVRLLRRQGLQNFNAWYDNQAHSGNELSEWLVALAASCHDNTLSGALQGLVMERAGSSGAGGATTGLPMAARRGASSLLLIGGWMAAAGAAGFCKHARATGQTPCRTQCSVSSSGAQWRTQAEAHQAVKCTAWHHLS